ncbi:DUF2207 domain-containing protein [Chryseomicrobium imtechense]
MTKKLLLPILFALLMTGLFPLQAFAIDFEIDTVLIDVQLEENGTAQVMETFTYIFEDDFNGITRSLIAKEGTAIENFTASENGTQLRTEFEDGEFRIYRAGDDGETIRIDLSYTVEKAVEKFEDGAQFYYAFFDDSNESTYEDMTIVVTPPQTSTDTEALGYGEAYGSERIVSDGSVRFEMGTVRDGRNGDVRAIFDAELFPGVAAQNGTIRDELAADRTKLEEEAAAFAANQQTAISVGVPIIAGAGTILLIGLFFAWFSAFNRKRAATSNANGFFVPKETLSIPGTLYFTNSPFLSPHVTAAAILDLVRKGNLTQVSEDEFVRVNRTTEHDHEATLLTLLVDRIGDGERFTLSQVKEFTSKTINHSAYNEAIAKWTKGVRAEVLSHDFYEKRPMVRWIAGALSALFVGLAVYTGIYEVYPWMAASIFFAFTAFVFALLYSPISVEGHLIRGEWRALKKSLPEVTEDEWKALTEDERKRAYAYLLGSDSKTAEKKAEAFTMASAVSQDNNFVMNPMFLMTIFVAANTSTSASASGGSVSSGGGSGVGGGGGGSGAF